MGRAVRILSAILCNLARLKNCKSADRGARTEHKAGGKRRSGEGPIAFRR